MQKFFRLTNLRKLSVSENELLRLSPHISSLTRLVELDVSKNGECAWVCTYVRACVCLRACECVREHVSVLCEWVCSSFSTCPCCSSGWDSRIYSLLSMPVHSRDQLKPSLEVSYLATPSSPSCLQITLQLGVICTSQYVHGDTDLNLMHACVDHLDEHSSGIGWLLCVWLYATFHCLYGLVLLECNKRMCVHACSQVPIPVGP